MNAFAHSLAMFYVSAAIGGIGAGAVYGTCVGNALKWFPDRRGPRGWAHQHGVWRGARR